MRTAWLVLVLTAHALVPPPRRVTRSPARRAQSAAADAAEKTWRSRRRLARAAFDARCAWDRAAAQAELEQEDEEDLDVVQSTVSTTAFGVVLVALVVRFGGRAALLQVLGLDVGADQEIAQRIDGFVVWARSINIAGFEDLGLWVGYAGAFTFAKVLCLDALTFLLAVSSGVLFGGVVKGALAATACATLGSTVAFGLARYGRPRLREKLLILVRRDPKTRALERAVVERGFATVLVLRLAPLLPIPIGGYNYLYGATAMDLVQFVPAMFLGSVKPYAFDAYLGVVGKQVVDDVAGGGAAAPGLSDPVIIGVFAAFLAIGALSSELAGQAWREIEEASAGDDDDGEYPDGDWLDVLEARESAPWRAWDGVAAQIAAREPAWSADLRARGRRARAALRAMARDELALARAEDAVVRAEEELPPREAGADEAARRRAFVGAFRVPPPAPDAGAIAAAPVPPGALAELDVQQALVESLLFSFVVGRAVFDEASLVVEDDDGAER